MITLSIDASQLIAFGEKLAKVGRDMPKTAVEAVNKGLAAGQPKASTMITSIYNVGSAPIEVQNASAGSSGHLKATGGSKPVSEFSPMEAGKGVSVEIIRGSRRIIRGAFMVHGRVMERRQPQQYPIYPVSTIGIAGMFGSKKISIPVQEEMIKIAEAEIANKIEL